MHVGDPRHPQLAAPVTVLKGVGPRIKDKLARLGIGKVQDLLFHLPFRYIDRTSITPIGSLTPGREFLVQGIIELTTIKYGRRRSLLCRISDGTGALTLRFFYFNRSQEANLAKGKYLRCWGQVRRGNVTMEMIHPEYQQISMDRENDLETTLTPVYPATEGIAQPKLRKLTDQALDILNLAGSELPELIPQAILDEFDLMDIASALAYVHRPPVAADTGLMMKGIHPCQQRLAFEELLAQHLSLRSYRRKIQEADAPVLTSGNEKTISSRFLHHLSFNLTGAQQRVISEIQQDLNKQRPMLRLIQGDVGSGKTVVAAIAALKAITAGYQVAFMAPTELLADQHYRNLTQWFAVLDITVLLLSGKQKKSERNKLLNTLASEAPLVAVGTHALFQEQVNFNNLGLIIIDEQHRFGVHQRLTLLNKGIDVNFQPHQLIMSATPIPRTLAMAVYADLDISIIDELPPGRQDINTTVLANEKRDEIISGINDLCKEGKQVYWVCTLIEESDLVQYQAASDTFDYLVKALPALNVDLVHGRMKSDEKEQVMKEFSSGNTDLLVATTVIEVGVDVPNACLIVIENAERLGLAQLHQLRGRVGRGKVKSNCILLYQPPLSELARARLETMRSSNDGFVIANKDMELRGPGDMLGTRQTGLPELRIADLLRDARMLPVVQKIADDLLENYPAMVKSLLDRWQTVQHGFEKV